MKDERSKGERGGGVGTHECIGDKSKHAGAYGGALIRVVDVRGGGGVGAELVM